MIVITVAEQKSNQPKSPNHVLHSAGIMLAVNFAHADHIEQNCISCHHNFVDDSGSGTCFDCHMTDPEVSSIIEDQFHTLCRGCHEEKLLAGEAHGPTRRCISCHIADNRP